MKLIVAVTLCYFRYTAVGFEIGPPTSTCLTMFPKHEGMDEQQTTSPYNIRVTPSTYSPGQQITVEVYSDDFQNFTGLQIRVRRTEGNTEKLLGKFSETEPAGKFQYLDCFGDKQNMVGHENKNNITKATMIWTAPDSNEGNLIFVFRAEDIRVLAKTHLAVVNTYLLSNVIAADPIPYYATQGSTTHHDAQAGATVVKDFYTFWYDVQALLRSETPSMPVAVNKPTTGIDQVEWNSCGDTKGCFMYPSSCSGADCMAAMSYRQSGEDYTIELMGSQEGYISLGLSPDQSMTDDETITCTSDKGKVTIQHGFNPDYYNERLYTFEQLKDMKVGFVDGKLYCQFTRQCELSWYSTRKMENFTFNLENDYYLMLAWGPVKVSEVMSHHPILPPVSNKKVNFREYIIHGGSVWHVLVQVHGILMIVGWVFFVGIGTVLARFYKENLGGKTKICGLAAWFQVSYQQGTNRTANGISPHCNDRLRPIQVTLLSRVLSAKRRPNERKTILLHRAVGVLAWVVVAVGFVLVFVHLDGWTKVALNHAYIGIAVMVGATLQVLGGMLRPDKGSKMRPFFNWGHLFLGTSCFILAAVNTILAFRITILPVDQVKFGTIVFAVWIAVQVVWELIFRIVACREKGFKSKDDIIDDRGDQFNIQARVSQKTSDHCKFVLLMLYIMTQCALVVAGILAIVLF